MKFCSDDKAQQLKFKHLQKGDVFKFVPDLSTAEGKCFCIRSAIFAYTNLKDGKRGSAEGTQLVVLYPDACLQEGKPQCTRFRR